MRVILTGATGMVGEGVLLTCLRHPAVTRVLVLGRRPCRIEHAKLRELIVPDFNRLADLRDQLMAAAPYNACFFCAGVSSVGMDEASYKAVTHDTTLNVARVLQAAFPAMVFIYVSGRSTDSTAQGKVMWARVKGQTENDLQRLGFKAQYNFRPALMLPAPGQKHLKPIYKWLIPLFKPFMGSSTLPLTQVGQAMIHAVQRGHSKPVLEVEDIRQLAQPAADLPQQAA